MQRADGELAAGGYRDLGASGAVPLSMWAGLVTVMALGLGLPLRRLGQNGYGTEYYSAGVRSMMDSPHNVLFNSFGVHSAQHTPPPDATRPGRTCGTHEQPRLRLLFPASLAL